MSILTTKLENLNFDELAQRMLRQLDSNEWKKVGQRQDVTVFLHKNLEDGIDGFKTVTEHNVISKKIIDFLGRNLCDAMQMMNKMYHSGEVLKVLYDNAADDYFAIARTNFAMPFPLTNREFLHALKVVRVDKTTILIIYHSVTDADLPETKKDFLRCPTYLSGQRISILPNGKTQVEHIMIYALGGKISKNVQNKLFKSGHIKAYLSEWQKLVDYFRIKKV